MLRSTARWLPAFVFALAVAAVVGAVWLLFERWFPLTAQPAAAPSLVRVAATPQPVALSRFENPDYPYDFGYPEGWTAVADDPESVAFNGPAGRKISVATQALPQTQPPLTLPVYADRQVEALRKQTPSLVELGRTRIVLPNAQAGVEVDLSWRDGSGPRRALLLYVLDAGLGFQLRADAPASAFPTERRLLDASLRSFALTPSD
jgi:hypothetical protein